VKKYLILILFSLFCEQAVGQILDVLRLEYTFIPSSGLDFNRARILSNIPIKVNEEKSAYLLLGADYSSIDLVFNKTFDSFDQEEIEDFRLLDINLGYTTNIGNDWRFGMRISPGFSSNLRTGDVLFDDIVWSGVILFINDKKEDSNVKKPHRILLGASYSENRGIPFPIPFISYYRKFHPKWSYNIGVPNSNLQYHWSPKTRLKLFAQLDGFNANLQEQVIVNGSQFAETIRMSLILGGLRFEYKLQKHIEFYLNTTYIIDNQVELWDSNNDEIFEFEEGTIHFKTGIRLKP